MIFASRPSYFSPSRADHAATTPAPRGGWPGSSKAPVLVPMLFLALGCSQPSQPLPLELTASISMGAEHSCMLNGEGRVLCWGNSWAGQLGQGDRVASPMLVPVPLVDIASQMAAGRFHTCSQFDDGVVSCWGSDRWSQIGDRASERCLVDGSEFSCATTPVQVEGLFGVAHISLSEQLSCGGSTVGVRCIGDSPFRLPEAAPGTGIELGPRLSCSWNDQGQPACVGEETLYRTESVMALNGIEDMAIGQRHVCVARSTGILCWGANNSGQLGNGETTAFSVELVTPTVAEPVGAVCAGAEHSCALGERGNVYCWGRNTYGQVSSPPVRRDACGGRSCEITPQLVDGLPPVIDLDCSDESSCALTTDEEMYCWGELVGTHLPQRIPQGS